MAPRIKKIARWLFALGLTFIVLTWVPVLTLRWVDPPLTAFMLLHNDEPFETTRYHWRDRDELGDLFALAVMAAEDQNFPHHRGLDVHAIAQALEEREQSGRLRGASGITQQLAKNLFLWPGRSLIRKGLEAYLAVVMEVLLPKKRILELYLNVVELGPGIYGAPAAAQYFFGTTPRALSPEQAALLAAVLPNPRRLKAGAPSEYVRERQHWIIEQAARLQREDRLTHINW
ncbi:MAG: monofunctional biosynthetic peptidoglycan transglycosylase [Gammaproteobacteria bacterium]